MDISRISRLISALGQSPVTYSPKTVRAQRSESVTDAPAQETQSQQQQQAQAQAQSEAVTLSSNFGQSAAAVRAAPPSDTVPREEKLAALKDRVRSGSYKPGSKDIAESVVRELFTS